MKSNLWCGVIALAASVLCFDFSQAEAQQLPAVSALNGKFEFNAGALTLPAPTFMGRAAGAITVPLGERFGLQADFSVSSSPGFTTSGALHLFARNPASYLIGGTLGFVHSPGATVLAAGPEAELYLDRWTISAWAGASLVRPAAPATPRLGPFAITSLSYYPTNNWRVSAGITSLDGYTSAQIGTEYLFDNLSLPLAWTGELRLGQDGAFRLTTGFRGYLGPNPDKTLIDRQRQDDPADLSTALYTAAGKTTIYDTPKVLPQSPTPAPTPPPGPTPSTPDPNSAAAADAGRHCARHQFVVIERAGSIVVEPGSLGVLLLLVAGGILFFVLGAGDIRILVVIGGDVVGLVLKLFVQPGECGVGVLIVV